MVADISLESLDSPSSDDNSRYQQSNQSTSCEGDINSNVRCDQEINRRLHFQPKLPELYNDQAPPSDKLLNELNEKLSPKSRMQNLNDWDFSHQNDLLESDTCHVSGIDYGQRDLNLSDERCNSSAETENYNHCNNSEIDHSNVTGMKTIERLPDAIPHTSERLQIERQDREQYTAEFNAERSPMNELIMHQQHIDMQMPKPDIVSSHEITHTNKTTSITDSTDSISNDYRPIVNIKTLGDENDGSYEICIQNIFTTNVIPLSKTEGHLQSNTDKMHLTSQSKSFHSGLKFYDENKAHDRDFKPMDSPCKIPKYDSSLSDSSSYGQSTFFRSKYKTDQRWTPMEDSSFQGEDMRSHTDYARLMSSTPNIKYEPLNLPYHTIRSVKTSPITHENSAEEAFTSAPEGFVPSGSKDELFSMTGGRKRRPRLLPKIPTDQQHKYREQTILKFEQSLRNNDEPLEVCLPANIKSPETISPKPSKEDKYTDNSVQGDTQGKGKRSRFWRPKSWAGSVSWKGDIEENIEEDIMTRSEYSGRTEYQHELPNTLSLASELNDAEEVYRQFEINGSSQQEMVLQSPLCSTKDTLCRAHTHPDISLEDLGSPEVIEPVSLVDSGYQQEQVATPDQVRILNEVNTLKSEASISKKEYPESEIWLRGLLSASFCNKCRSTSPFNIMKRSLEEGSFAKTLETKKSPTDLYIDDIPKSKEADTRQLILEFKRDEKPRGRYDLDKNALQLHFLQTPMDEKVDPFPIPQQEERDPSIGEDVNIDIEDFDVTHRGCHKFIPRHPGELFIEIGDPLYVEAEEDDLWCKGLNLRTKKKGIFPSVCATDLTFQDGLESIRPIKYYLRFLGSIEIGANHKSNKVLQQAIDKVVMTRKMKSPDELPPLRCLEINCQGIRMSNKVKAASLWSKTSPKVTQEPDSGCSSQSDEPMERSTEIPGLPEHFFLLKNVSFCGCHPKNDKYLAFITKHPLELRFACHVFLGENSIQPVVDSIGRAFKSYTHQYLAASHPTEDIYLE